MNRPKGRCIPEPRRIINAPNHIVNFSGGVCSWCATKRVIERHPNENIVLLFADTNMEDEDLYRFLDDSESYFGIPITRIADGRTPWQVFEDVKLIGSYFADPCSRILKRELLIKWIEDNYVPRSTVIHYGMDWTELPRFERVKEIRKPWDCRAYMTEKPLLSKSEMIKEVESAGIRAPRLYGLGFAHNNCGGFCIKSGSANFALLLHELPERYKWHEQQEKRIMPLQKLSNHTILKRRNKDGEYVDMTMEEFRKRIYKYNLKFSPNACTGCGCAVD